MSENGEAKFEAWGCIDLFGHQRLAGKLSEQTIGGVHFIRIDVPELPDVAPYTRFFTQGAIYGMTPMEESTARKLAAYLRATPVSTYELRAAAESPRIAHSAAATDDDEVPY